MSDRSSTSTRTGRRALRALATVLVSTAAVLSTAVVPAQAQVLVDDVPTGAWRVNGTTQAVLVVGNVVYVGGDFTQASGPGGATAPRVNLAAFDASTGALLSFRADANNVVRALTTDGSSLYAGGSFSTVGGVTRNRIAQLNLATGAVQPLNIGTAGIVYALDARAGRLFAGGTFSTIGGQPRNRAAAVVLATNTLDPQFAPQPDGTVRAIRSNPAGSVVYLAGELTSVGGSARTGVAAVSGTTGAVTTPVFGNTYNPTIGLDMNEDGSRLFAAVAGAGNQAASFNTATGVRLWSQRADGDVQAVAYHSGTVYWGFHDGWNADTTIRLLACDSVTGAIDPNFRPTFNRFWGVYGISVTDDVVAIAGDFTNLSGVQAQGVGVFNHLLPPPVDYITAATSWRYFDHGSLPGAGWATGGFADGTWASGLPQLGYGDGDEATVVSYGPSSSNKYPTTYFRATFDVAALPGSAGLTLLADDGAVVYLNGVEVVRDNMPAGAVGYGTFAAANRSGTDENAYRSFVIDPAGLVVGVNTIAVEVHQDLATSSDLGFDLTFTGQP